MTTTKPDFFHGSLSPQDVHAVIRNALGSNVKIVDYKAKSYSETRVGFLGAHSLLEVTVQKNNTSLKVHSFFVKCIPRDSEKEERMINELQVFKCETTFFRHVVPELLKNFESEPWAAECYLVKDNVLVFENLKLKNFRMCDLIFDEATVKGAASTLARFHAASIVAEKRLNRSFQEMYPGTFQNRQFHRDGIFYKWFLAGIDVIIGVAQSLDLDTRKVRNYLMRMFEITKPSRTRRNILCHSDLWSNNIMVNDSSKCIIVDYQALRYAPPAADLAHLIYYTMLRKSRDVLEKSIIQRYHEVFKETIMRNDPDVVVRNLEELLEEYEEYRQFGLSYAALAHPQIYMGEELRTELSKDSAAYEKFFFEERTGLVMELMEKDPDYGEKIAELVKEVVEHANKS